MNSSIGPPLPMAVKASISCLNFSSSLSSWQRPRHFWRHFSCDYAFVLTNYRAMAVNYRKFWSILMMCTKLCFCMLAQTSKVTSLTISIPWLMSSIRFSCLRSNRSTSCSSMFSSMASAWYSWPILFEIFTIIWSVNQPARNSNKVLHTYFLKQKTHNVCKDWGKGKKLSLSRKWWQWCYTHVTLTWL